jgi:[ribosomal protein S18]-alanine N-acetyltransferase
MLDEPGYRIEDMSTGDIDEVAAIEQASFSDPWPARYFFTELSTNKLALYLVARAQGRVIAYIGSWMIFEETHITTLAVEEQYRKQGLASGLLEELLNRVIPRGVSAVTLEVRPSNFAARHFYLKHGFKACGYRKRYYKDEDAIIMTKQL